MKLFFRLFGDDALNPFTIISVKEDADFGHDQIHGLNGKTMGKPWENHRKTIGKWWFNRI